MSNTPSPTQSSSSVMSSVVKTVHHGTLDAGDTSFDVVEDVTASQLGMGSASVSEEEPDTEPVTDPVVDTETGPVTDPVADTETEPVTVVETDEYESPSQNKELTESVVGALDREQLEETLINASELNSELDAQNTLLAIAKQELTDVVAATTRELSVTNQRVSELEKQLGEEKEKSAKLALNLTEVTAQKNALATPLPSTTYESRFGPAAASAVVTTAGCILLGCMGVLLFTRSRHNSSRA